jgi:hypothetical protein
LSQATKIQEQVANKESRALVDDRNLKAAFEELTKKFDKMYADFTDCKHRLESRIMQVRTLEEKENMLKEKLSKYMQINHLLVSAVSNYEKSWFKFSHEYEFYQNFYSVFLDFLNDQY